MLDLDQAIRERHSTRMFLPGPVPRELMNEAVTLAPPSNSNIQPWHVVFVSGLPRDRLVAAQLGHTAEGVSKKRMSFFSGSELDGPTAPQFSNSGSDCARGWALNEADRKRAAST
jgi:nitroreductase